MLPITSEDDFRLRWSAMSSSTASTRVFTWIRHSIVSEESNDPEDCFFRRSNPPGQTEKYSHEDWHARLLSAKSRIIRCNFSDADHVFEGSLKNVAQRQSHAVAVQVGEGYRQRGRHRNVVILPRASTLSAFSGAVACSKKLGQKCLRCQYSSVALSEIENFESMILSARHGSAQEAAIKRIIRTPGHRLNRRGPDVATCHQPER